MNLGMWRGLRRLIVGVALTAVAAWLLFCFLGSMRRRRPAPRSMGVGFHGRVTKLWLAANANDHVTAASCGACVMDPLALPEVYCSVAPTAVDGAPLRSKLEELEPTATAPEAALRLLAAVGNTVGVLGDSFMQQALDALACELRRLGQPDRAGFIRWDVVLDGAGRLDESSRPMRYHWGGPHGARPRWFMLSQQFYNAGEVAKVLSASRVVIINYGLHCSVH